MRRRGRGQGRQGGGELEEEKEGGAKEWRSRTVKEVIQGGGGKASIRREGR